MAKQNIAKVVFDDMVSRANTTTAKKIVGTVLDDLKNRSNYCCDTNIQDELIEKVKVILDNKKVV